MPKNVGIKGKFFEFELAAVGKTPVPLEMDAEKSSTDEIHLICPTVDYTRGIMTFFAKREPGSPYFNKFILYKDGSYSWTYHGRSTRRHGRSRFQMNIFWKHENGTVIFPAIHVLTDNIKHQTTRIGSAPGHAPGYEDRLEFLLQDGVRPYFTTTLHNSKHNHG